MYVYVCVYYVYIYVCIYVYVCTYISLSMREKGNVLGPDGEFRNSPPPSSLCPSLPPFRERTDASVSPRLIMKPCTFAILEGK